MKKISVILPAFNERENIIPLIHATREALRDLSFEILVVDDKSPDGTAQVVRDLGDSSVRVIVRTENPGYAKSIRCGIENSEGDLLILMDSDFNHDPHCISEMVAQLSEFDCVSGSRFLEGGRMTPAWRGIASKLFNILVCWMTGSRMTDNLFGFFGVRREALERCPFDDIFFGFGDYGMRLLFYLQKNKARIFEFSAVCGSRLAGHGNRRFLKTLCLYMRAVWALAEKGRII